MKKIIKGRWVIFIIWFLAAVVLTVIQPDINAILHEKGQSALSEDSDSVKAEKILKKMSITKGTSDIILFYDEDGLSDDEKTQIGEVLSLVREKSDKLGITEMIEPFTLPQATSLYSKDGTALMVSLKVDKGDTSVDDLKENFDKILKNSDVKYYLTGEDFIQNDYLQASQSGIEKSAALTVLFILIVLIIMFRSVITPIISLIGVAFSYIVSMGISAQLIDKADFPLTSLSQMLLILILFGIGTDYNILLFSRFREELSRGLKIDDAIIQTYKTAGKTIAYSIITVLIAFLSLIFAESPIYQSGVIVVIGAAILLLEILTLTPFAMKLLGTKLFWPSKNAEGHKESKVWGKMSSFSSKHPVFSFIAVVIAILPMVFFNKEKLSFNLVGELGDSYSSSEGFNLIAEHYGDGQIMPSTIVIKSDTILTDNESLLAIDALTENLSKIDGVNQVSSITRPQGEKIEASENTSVSEELYKSLMQMFYSSDMKITKLSVVLNDDPYSNEAQDTVKEIREVLNNTLEKTSLKDSYYGVAGTTATTADTNDILSRDLQRTAIILIIGVFLVLLFVIKSIWAPLVIVASLIGAFFTASTVSNLIFINIIGYEGISSFVPFFAFIIIVALGVDYSIFVMMRFKEYSDQPVKEAIQHACKHIGGVVMSAIIILGGTFATLMPSGLVMLEELAITVIIGLIMLCLVLLPIFLPAALSLKNDEKK
jgi:uncharacterized membrane protein YdfJ with MMPL/SSD domain